MDWIKVFSSLTEAKQKLIESKPQLLTVEGRRICVVRRGERFYAFQDRCPHNGESLSKGSLNYLGEVICPFHGYCFSIKTGRESSERTQDLEIYPVKAEESGFYIGI